MFYHPGLIQCATVMFDPTGVINLFYTKLYKRLTLSE